jgi:hypothetical protein
MLKKTLIHLVGGSTMAEVDPNHYQEHSGYFTPTSLMVVVCSTASLYNALELVLLIFTTFKRYTGLYFWSLLLSSVAVIPYSVGYVMVYFKVTYLGVGVGINTPGWVVMITGQSVVLYSRLHLVLHNRRILRWVLWMIIFNGVVWHPMATVLNYGSIYAKDSANFTAVFAVVEKVQMTCFCAQEFIISGLYLFETARLLKVVSNENTRSIMWQLFVINVIIVGMDIGLLALEYKDLRVLEQTFKGAIYSVKLKLEFAILGKLVTIIGTTGDRQISDAMDHPDDFVDRTRTLTDVTHASPKKTTERPYWPKEELNNEASIIHVETVGEAIANSKKTCEVAATESKERHSSTEPSNTNRDADLERIDSQDMYADFVRSITRGT